MKVKYHTAKITHHVYEFDCAQCGYPMYNGDVAYYSDEYDVKACGVSCLTPQVMAKQELATKYVWNEEEWDWVLAI